MCRDLISSLESHNFFFFIVGIVILFRLSPKIGPPIKIIAGLKDRSLAKRVRVVFFVVIVINFRGLFPLVYGYSTRYSLILILGLIIFLFPLLRKITLRFKDFIRALVPRGSPIVLAPFLVLIETISLLIRPFTLRLRLVANISAGHIILGLCAILLSRFSWRGIIYLFYYIFEFFVAVIQTYIFSLLVLMYETR